MGCVFTTAVFDLGGVLADWDPRYLYRSLFDDEPEMERFLADICTPEWNHTMDAGRSQADAVAELVEKYPDESVRIRAWIERWDEMLGSEIAGTAEIIAELDRRRVRLLALTNWSAETFPHARNRFPALARFEAIVVSGEHGTAKPDPELYRILLDEHAVEPAASVYIDDAPANVVTARDLGMTGIRFTDPASLRTELVRLGLLDGSS
jgi:2-haloacid dehalogenase